jgi:hypothetical protein
VPRQRRAVGEMEKRSEGEASPRRLRGARCGGARTAVRRRGGGELRRHHLAGGAAGALVRLAGSVRLFRGWARDAEVCFYLCSRRWHVSGEGMVLLRT